MRTLKIGRSSSNDIVISDVRVSSQHAIITILDTREVRIKDLNSTNGTFVNGKRISVETTITDKDVITVANSPLDWVKFLNERKSPQAQPAFVGDPAAIKRRKTIGRIVGNDIIFSQGDVSSNHAQLIEKVTGEIVIADSGSANGTYVNGQKISMQTLRPGDRVMIAKKYPLEWEGIFGSGGGTKSNSLKKILIAAASVAAIIIGIIFVPKIVGGGSMKPEQIYAKYKKSVVMVEIAYYYQVYIDGELFGNYMGLQKDRAGNIQAVMSEKGEPKLFSGTGTGFIVSNDGKIVTNRHIISPWNYAVGDEKQEVDFVKSYVENLVLNASIYDISYLSKLGKVTVVGKMYEEYLGVYINDTHKSESSKIPCHVIKESGSDDIDIGVIQINSKTLPAGVDNIVDLSKAVIDDKDIEDGASIYLMGFPLGEMLASTSSGIQADHQEGTISQVGEEYSFRHSAASFGGASGSPIFNKKGQLIGIHHAGMAQAGVHGYGWAIKAKYAVELVK